MADGKPSGSLAERLLAAPSGPRVFALEVERGYRDASADELSIGLARYARCSECRRRGCERCEYVGWTVEQTAARVPVPHGATPGTRITIEGAGDAVDGVARPIVVEIVEPGPRADELRAAQADFEGKLETAWSMERAAHGGRRRRVKIAVAVAATALLLIPIGGYLAKPGTGEPCTTDSDCRSSHCLRLMTVPGPETGMAPRLDGQVCTASCTTDLDCPSTMGCRARFVQPTPKQIALGVPDGLACIPKGY